MNNNSSKFMLNTEIHLSSRVNLQGVVTTDELTPDLIEDLAEKRIVAVRVPNYYPPDFCNEIASRVDNDPELSDYDNAPIARLGKAFFEAEENDVPTREEYHGGAIARMKYLRGIFDYYQSPLDRLCRELDESWCAGASTYKLAGRPMNVGIFRNFKSGSEAEPHQDEIGWDAPFHKHPFVSQLAANVYLRPSTEGGELELWEQRFNHADYQNHRSEFSTYGLDRGLLPPPKAVLVPQKGELIIFNASRVHAVRPTAGTSRITIAAFIGYAGRYDQLGLFS